MKQLLIGKASRQISSKLDIGISLPNLYNHVKDDLVLALFNNMLNWGAREEEIRIFLLPWQIIFLKGRTERTKILLNGVRTKGYGGVGEQEELMFNLGKVGFNVIHQYWYKDRLLMEILKQGFDNSEFIACFQSFVTVV